MRYWLGERIAYYREQAGLSQEALSLAAGLPKGAIGEIENAGLPGKRRRRDLKDKEHGPIARALGVTVAELTTNVGHTDEPVEIKGATARATADGRNA